MWKYSQDLGSHTWQMSIITHKAENKIPQIIQLLASTTKERLGYFHSSLKIPGNRSLAQTIKGPSEIVTGPWKNMTASEGTMYLVYKGVTGSEMDEGQHSEK